MSQPVVDTLQLCDALRRTGMEREQAEGLARALGDELGAHVVAQGDLQTGFLEVRGEIQSVDHRVDLARTELVGQIGMLGGRIDALDGKVDSVRTEVGGEIKALRTTLGIVGGAIGLLLTGVGLVAGTALLRPPAPSPWYGPPSAAVSAPAPAVGQATHTGPP